MKLLLALLISVFSLSSFAQPDFDLSGRKINAKICKSVEAEIGSLSKQIESIRREIKKLSSVPKPNKLILLQIKQLQEKLEALEKRRAALSAFYEKHCKKDVVDCDQLKLKIGSLEKQLIGIREQIVSLEKELQIAIDKGNKIKAEAIKSRLSSLNAEAAKIIETLNKLKELYKKNC
jgi:hypothetical protein